MTSTGYCRSTDTSRVAGEPHRCRFQRRVQFQSRSIQEGQDGTSHAPREGTGPRPSAQSSSGSLLLTFGNNARQRYVATEQPSGARNADRHRGEDERRVLLTIKTALTPRAVCRGNWAALGVRVLARCPGADPFHRGGRECDRRGRTRIPPSAEEAALSPDRIRGNRNLRSRRGLLNQSSQEKRSMSQSPVIAQPFGNRCHSVFRALSACGQHAIHVGFRRC